MFRKYEKTYRFFPTPGKINLSKNDISELLSGEVIVEEKMDGANVGIIRHKHGFSLQKRGSLVGQSEHEQFGYFHNWANNQNYELLMNLPVNHIIYAELLYAVHTVFYDKLPSYVLVFDVWDGNSYLNYDKRKDFCDMYNLHMVPLVTRGSFSKNDISKLIPEKSMYGDFVEGIVLKRYRKNEYLKAKVVNPDFIKIVNASEHWSHYNIRKNIVCSQ